MTEVARQQLQHKVDVMIGGGKRWFAPLLDEARTYLFASLVPIDACVW